jgi:mercuric ion transport protein
MDGDLTQTGLAEPQSRGKAAPGAGKAGLAAAGGILAALGAAACCVVPFTLFLLGVTGAWIGDLTALEPYQPIFAGLALGFIGYGAYRVYRRPETACAEGSYCARPASSRLARIGLWSAAVLVVIAVGFPYLIRSFFGS